MISNKVQYLLDNMKYHYTDSGIIYKNEKKYLIIPSSFYFAPVGDFDAEKEARTHEFQVHIDVIKNDETMGHTNFDITKAEYHLLKDRIKDLHDEFHQQTMKELFG